jgi:2-phosphosulfolactate phosphatase
MNSIEVCFSPALYDYKVTRADHIIVIVDVLRATTAFCAAFDRGVKAIIPVAGVELARKYKKEGFLVVAERGGEKLDFADFSNSPLDLLNAEIEGKTLVYSTTNGTQAIEKAKDAGSIAVGCFSNLSLLSEWLHQKNSSVLILCSGWENTFSLEDSLCAGAITDSLLKSGQYSVNCDAAHAALDLWVYARKNIQGYLSKANHYKRLEKLGCQNDLAYCLQLDISSSLPVWNGVSFVNSLSTGSKPFRNS